MCKGMGEDGRQETGLGSTEVRESEYAEVRGIRYVGVERFEDTKLERDRSTQIGSRGMLTHGLSSMTMT
jgi:hypothetical protein